MIEKYTVIYSQEALNDLRKIYAYIAYELKVPDVAQKQISHIRKEICSLDFMPMRYALVDWEPWQSMKMHKVPIGKYITFYTVDEDSLIVTIIRVFYGGQDVESIINSEPK